MSEYFLEPKSSGGRMKVALDLFMQQIQILKAIQHELIYQNLLKKGDLAYLKSKTIRH